MLEGERWRAVRVSKFSGLARTANAAGLRAAGRPTAPRSRYPVLVVRSLGSSGNGGAGGPQPRIHVVPCSARSLGFLDQFALAVSYLCHAVPYGGMPGVRAEV